MPLLCLVKQAAGHTVDELVAQPGVLHADEITLACQLRGQRGGGACFVQPQLHIAEALGDPGEGGAVIVTRQQPQARHTHARILAQRQDQGLAVGFQLLGEMQTQRVSIGQRHAVGVRGGRVAGQGGEGTALPGDGDGLAVFVEAQGHRAGAQVRHALRDQIAGDRHGHDVEDVVAKPQRRRRLCIGSLVMVSAGFEQRRQMGGLVQLAGAQPARLRITRAQQLGAVFLARRCQRRQSLFDGMFQCATQ